MVFNLLLYTAIISRMVTRVDQEISQENLTDIFIIALESFIPERGIDDKDYLILHLENKVFDPLDTGQKEQIMNYFSDKYEIEVLNEFYEDLHEKGYANKYGDLISGDKRGILLDIEDFKVNSHNDIEVKGFWLVGPIGARGATSTITKEDDKWRLLNRYWTWIS